LHTILWLRSLSTVACALSRGRPSEMMCGDPAGSSTLRNGCQPYLLASLTSIAARFRACASMRASPKDNNCSIATTRPAIETYDIVDCVYRRACIASDTELASNPTRTVSL